MLDTIQPNQKQWQRFSASKAFFFLVHFIFFAWFQCWFFTFHSCCLPLFIYFHLDFFFSLALFTIRNNLRIFSVKKKRREATKTKKSVKYLWWLTLLSSVADVLRTCSRSLSIRLSYATLYTSCDAYTRIYTSIQRANG